MKEINDNMKKTEKNIINDVFQRLRYVEKMHFKNRSAAAVAAGVSIPTFSRWVAGQDPSFEGMVRIAASSGVSLQWLATGNGPMRMDEAASTGDFVLVPLYEQRAAAGHGAAASDEQPSGFFSLRRDWVRATLGGDPAHLAILPATGDSMEPLIADGDLLLVDLSVTTPSGIGVYVLERDGDLLVKRVHPLLSGGLVIEPLNKAYPVESWSPGKEHGLRFVGRVRMVSRAV